MCCIPAAAKIIEVEIGYGDILVFVLRMYGVEWKSARTEVDAE